MPWMEPKISISHVHSTNGLFVRACAPAGTRYTRYSTLLDVCIWRATARARPQCLSRLACTCNPRQQPQPQPQPQPRVNWLVTTACMHCASLRCVAGRVSGAVACRHGPMASAGVPLPPVRGPYCQWGEARSTGTCDGAACRLGFAVCRLGLVVRAGLGLAFCLVVTHPWTLVSVSHSPCVLHARRGPFPFLPPGPGPGRDARRSKPPHDIRHATRDGGPPCAAVRCGAVRLPHRGLAHTAAGGTRPASRPATRQKTIALLRRHSSSAARTAALLACRVAKGI